MALVRLIRAPDWLATKSGSTARADDQERYNLRASTPNGEFEVRDLAELLEQLRQRGFDRCFDSDIEYLSSARKPSDQNVGSVRLVDVIQLDAGTDPGDDVTVYLLETDSGIRGYLLVPDSFHTDPGKARFVDALMASRRTANEH